MKVFQQILTYLVVSVAFFRFQESFRPGPSVLLCPFLSSVLWQPWAVGLYKTEWRLQNILGKIMKWATSAWQGTAVFSLPIKKKGVNWFVQYWTLACTRPRLTPSPHQPFCRPLSISKHTVKDEWWSWLLFPLCQDPSYHERQWFGKDGSSL